MQINLDDPRYRRALGESAIKVFAIGLAIGILIGVIVGFGAAS